MSTKNILDLPPIKPNFGFGLDITGINTEDQKLPRRDVRVINQDSIRRRVVIDTIAANGEKAIDRVLTMDQNGFGYLFEKTQFVTEMNEESQGTPYQKYSDAFTDRMIKVMANHTFGFLEVGAMRIAYEVNRPPESEESKGLWGLFFK